MFCFLSILGAITFGKPTKGNLSYLFFVYLYVYMISLFIGYLYNLREFKVYIGEKRSHLVEVLHSGFYNDGENETLLVSQYIGDNNDIVCVIFLFYFILILIFIILIANSLYLC